MNDIFFPLTSGPTLRDRGLFPGFEPSALDTAYGQVPSGTPWAEYDEEEEDAEEYLDRCAECRKKDLLKRRHMYSRMLQQPPADQLINDSIQARTQLAVDRYIARGYRQGLARGTRQGQRPVRRGRSLPPPSSSQPLLTELLPAAKAPAAAPDESKKTDGDDRRLSTHDRRLISAYNRRRLH